MYGHVLDLAIVLFCLRAVQRTAALRWWPGVALALATLGAWSAVGVLGWCEHAAERFMLIGVFVLALLGATSIGTGGALLRALATGCALAGFVLANRRHARISPLHHASVPWSDAALAFLGPLLLTGGQQAIFLLGTVLAHD